MRIIAIYYCMILGSLLLTETTIAQNTSPYPTGTPLNYIRTWVAIAPESDGSLLMTRPIKDVKQVTQYLDGLGRPLQTVSKMGSLQTDPNNPQTSVGAKDFVSTVLYDELGREQYQLLPFASTENSGIFKSDPFQQQQIFMQSQYSLQGESFFYGKTDFESSPLSRTQKVMAPGNSWVGNGRGVGMKYWVNTNADAVRIWNVSNSGINGLFGSYSTAVTNGGLYAPGILFKNITVDEHEKQVIEFKDTEGKVILKKVQLTATIDDGQGTGYNNWLCTYYIYDEYNRLRCVIQPEGVKWLSDPLHNWVLNSSDYNLGGIVAEQFFRYEYDTRGRMIMKKVPGAGEVYMVYDGRDRLIMTQDANLRSINKWLVTKYDELNRPKETGLWDNNGNSFEGHLNAANITTTEYPVTTNGYDVQTKIQYDNYSGIPVGLNYKTDWNNYFDATDITNWPYPQMPQMSSAVKGMVTWTQTRIIGTSIFLNTVTYYDDKGQVIQVQSTNSSGGTDVNTTQYSWAGQPLISVLKQEKQGANAQTTILVTKQSYDELGRLVKVEKKQGNTLVNGGTLSVYKTILKNEYDKLGQLKKKEIGTSPVTSTALETLNYDYNIRGWMLGMNRFYLNTGGQSGNTRFGFELGYDKTDNAAGNSYTSPQYNGNISGMTWKSDGDDIRRKYDFSYDAVNRLLKGDFKQDNGGTSWDNFQMNYNMQMGNGTDPLTAYDANGNIKAMTQYGWKLGGSPTNPIDNLTYSYFPGTNKLMTVSDLNTTNNKLGDFYDKNTGTVDYGYDRNGNMVTDLNKDISGATGSEVSSGGAITYNYLNLPSHILVSGKGSISYTYDAAGNKLQKTVAEIGKPIKTTLYLSGAIYENDVLQLFVHEEGRIRALYNNNTTPAIPTGFAYDFMLKDHLGNVRMLLTEEQKQNYYPATTLEGSTTAGALSMVNEEKKYYTIDNTKIVNKPWSNVSFDYPNHNGNPPANLSYPAGTTPISTATSTKVYQLNATTNTMANKTGLGIVLKVMAGDAVNIFGRSFHKKPTTGGGYSGTTNSIAVLDLINAFVGTSVVAGKGISGSQITGQTGFPSDMLGLIGNQPAQDANRPKAAINWIVFDEQFKWVSGGFDMVGSAANNNGVNNTYTTTADGTRKIHNLSTIPTINIPKNGYIYVWVSNESKFNVYFDNLQVVHTLGSILEETHYYPFGLTMAGISSYALRGTYENFYKWNKGSELQNKEFSDGSGLDLYTTQFRSIDPQIGRFIQIDPKPVLSESVYIAMGNNPVLKNDPLGDTSNFYNSKGSLIGQRDDGEKYITPTIIGDQNLDKFNGLYNTGRKHYDDDKSFNSALRNLGITYDVKSFSKFFEDNKYKFKAKFVAGYKISGMSNIVLDGKKVKASELYAEATGNTILKNGVVTVGKNPPKSSYNMTSSDPLAPGYEIGITGGIHLHPVYKSTLMKFDYTNGFTKDQTNATIRGGNTSPEDRDDYLIRNSGTRFVMVDQKYIYLFNSSPTQTIIIPRL